MLIGEFFLFDWRLKEGNELEMGGRKEKGEM